MFWMLEPNVTKFYNAAKLGGAMDPLEGRKALQRDLDNLECWAVTNQMKFNTSKPRIFCLGQRNLGYMDKLGDGRDAGSNTAERDLGFGLMKMSALSALAARRANRVLGVSGTATPGRKGR